MLFRPEQHILFIGDSITDCGRDEVQLPYGNGFVSLVHAFVTARYPEFNLRWTNRGVSGNTVRDLAARWEEDAIAVQPDWLAIMVGANDCSRRYNPERLTEAVYVEEYESTMRSLLQRAVDTSGCKLVIAEPYVIEADPSDQRLIDTRELCLASRRVAQDMGAISIRTQELFDHVLNSTTTTDWAPDRVHPNLAGHGLIAMEFLRAIEFEFDRTPGDSR